MMKVSKTFKKVCLWAVSVPIGAAVLFALILLCMQCFYRVTGRMDPETGIEEQGYVSLCGQEIAYNIRGNDTSNPVILWLHGGPGVPDMVATYFTAGELADDYTFVNFNQRGCGRTYFRNLTADPDCETVTFEQALLDTDAMVDWVCERFGQEKVILIGFSYGTMLGVKYVQEHPEKVAAYVGVGQLAGELDYWADIPEEGLNDPEYQRGSPVMKGLTSPFLKLIDLRWLRIELAENDVFYYSQEKLNEYMYSHTVEEFGTDFTMPVGFLSGACDETCPVEAVRSYCEQINAPVKKLLVVEHRGHDYAVESQEEFAADLRGLLEEIMIH